MQRWSENPFFSTLSPDTSPVLLLPSAMEQQRKQEACRASTRDARGYLVSSSTAVSAVAYALERGGSEWIAVAAALSLDIIEHIHGAAITTDDNYTEEEPEVWGMVPGTEPEFNDPICTCGFFTTAWIVTVHRWICSNNARAIRNSLEQGMLTHYLPTTTAWMELLYLKPRVYELQPALLKYILESIDFEFELNDPDDPAAMRVLLSDAEDGWHDTIYRRALYDADVSFLRFLYKDLKRDPRVDILREQKAQIQVTDATMLYYDSIHKQQESCPLCTIDSLLRPNGKIAVQLRDSGAMECFVLWHVELNFPLWDLADKTVILWDRCSFWIDNKWTRGSIWTWYLGIREALMQIHSYLSSAYEPRNESWTFSTDWNRTELMEMFGSGNGIHYSSDFPKKEYEELLREKAQICARTYVPGKLTEAKCLKILFGKVDYDTYGVINKRWNVYTMAALFHFDTFHEDVIKWRESGRGR